MGAGYCGGRRGGAPAAATGLLGWEGWGAAWVACKSHGGAVMNA